MTAPLRHPLPQQLPRIARLARLPVFFSLSGRKVLVAGGSPAAAWKAELLAAAGARVCVFTPDPCEELLSVEETDVSIIRRNWLASDLLETALAVGAFDTDDEAREFAAASRAAAVPVNVIDKPDFCDFSFGAIVNRSPLVIGISTDGAAPALGQAIRSRIEALLSPQVARWIEAAARWRSAVKSSGLAFNQRRRFWQMLASRSTESGADPSAAEFQLLLVAAKEEGSDAGSIQVIEVLQTQPDLLTLRAVRALQKAEVLVFDDSIPFDVLGFSRREARRVKLSAAFAGDPPHETAVAELLERHQASGAHVVYLKAVS